MLGLPEQQANRFVTALNDSLPQKETTEKTLKGKNRQKKIEIKFLA